MLAAKCLTYCFLNIIWRVTGRLADIKHNIVTIHMASCGFLQIRKRGRKRAWRSLWVVRWTWVTHAVIEGDHTGSCRSRASRWERWWCPSAGHSWRCLWSTESIRGTPVQHSCCQTTGESREGPGPSSMVLLWRLEAGGLVIWGEVRGAGLVCPEEEMTGEGGHLTADCLYLQEGCRGTQSQTLLRSAQLKDKR